jgi:hypothetical protein
MSLAFVSSAVLSSTDGVSHNEEKAIDSKEVRDVRSRQAGGQLPLFQQLQANKDKEDEERAESQRNIMRGTMTLDDEDCAHLDAIQKQKDEQQQSIRQSMDEELALFRAAKADRTQSQLLVEEDNEEKKISPVIVPDKRRHAASFVQKIVIKKKRMRQKPESYDTSSKKAKETSKDSGTEGPCAEGEIEPGSNVAACAEPPHSGLSLLGGYGSSDSDSD